MESAKSTLSIFPVVGRRTKVCSAEHATNRLRQIGRKVRTVFRSYGYRYLLLEYPDPVGRSGDVLGDTF